MPDTFICSPCNTPKPLDQYAGRVKGFPVCRSCIDDSARIAKLVGRDVFITPVKFDSALEWCEACAAAKEPGHAETCTREPHFPRNPPLPRSDP